MDESIRCHTTPSRRPIIAVASAEGSVDLFEWEFEQVSYALSYQFSPSPHITQRIHLRNNCETQPPCAWPPLMSCAYLSTGPIGGCQQGMNLSCFVVLTESHPLLSTAGSLAMSLSDGALILLEPDQTGQLAVTNTWAAHAHEPWCVAWNYWDSNMIYSGVYSFPSVNACLLMSCHQEGTTCSSRYGTQGRVSRTRSSPTKGMFTRNAHPMIVVVE